MTSKNMIAFFSVEFKEEVSVNLIADLICFNFALFVHVNRLATNSSNLEKLKDVAISTLVSLGQIFGPVRKLFRMKNAYFR